MQSLRIEEIKDGANIEVGVIRSGQITVGRRPDGQGITIDNDAISRNHGRFIAHKNHWFYRDLGSTNGSWVNGIPVKPEQWRLIRPGDVVQLGNVALKVSAEENIRSYSITGFPAMGGRSLIVFEADEYLNEFPVSEYGRSLAIGGNQADLPLTGDVEEVPALVVERRADDVCAYSIAKSSPVQVNGADISELTVLKDGDEIRVGSYIVLFNDPSVVLTKQAERPGIEAVAPAMAADRPPSPETSSVREWGAQLDSHGQPISLDDAPRRNTTTFVFGRSHEEIHEEGDETIAVEGVNPDSTLSGWDRHPSMRYVTQETQLGYSLSSIEDKIVIFIGLLLLLALMGLVVWWVLV